MEDIKDLMDRLKKRIISGGAADKPELKRRLDVIYEIYAGAVGPEDCPRKPLWRIEIYSS